MTEASLKFAPLMVEPGRKPVRTSDEPVARAVEAAISKIRRAPYGSCVSREIITLAIETFLRSSDLWDLANRVDAYDVEQFERL